jgi:hypothetical protein
MCQKCSREQRRGLFLPQAATRKGQRVVARAPRPLHSVEAFPPQVWLQLVSFLGWIDGLDILRLISKAVYTTFSTASDDYWLLCAKAAHSQCLTHSTLPAHTIKSSALDEPTCRAMRAMVVTLQDPLDEDEYYHAYPDTENVDYSWKGRLGLAQRKARWARTQARNSEWISSGCKVVSDNIFAANNIVLVLQEAGVAQVKDAASSALLLSGAELEAQVWKASCAPMHSCASGALIGTIGTAVGGVVCVLFLSPGGTTMNSETDMAALTQVDVQQALAHMFELMNTAVDINAMQVRLPHLSREMPYEVYHVFV